MRSRYYTRGMPLYTFFSSHVIQTFVTIVLLVPCFTVAFSTTTPFGSKESSRSEEKKWASDDAHTSVAPPAAACPLDCGKHGTCSCAGSGDGCDEPWCDCGASDWMGHRCESNIKTAWKYYPELSTPRHVRSLERQWNPEAFDVLVANVTAVQSDRKLCTEKWHTVVPAMMGLAGQGSGYASTIRYMTIFPQEALSWKKPFVYAGRWNYAKNKVCASRRAFGKFECYFKNWSPGCGVNTQRLQARYKWPEVAAKGSAGSRCLESVIGRHRCQNMRLYEKVPEPWGSTGDEEAVRGDGPRGGNNNLNPAQ